MQENTKRPVKKRPAHLGGGYGVLRGYYYLGASPGAQPYGAAGSAGFGGVEDDYLLILNKPPYMPVHPSPGHDDGTLCNFVSFYQRQKGEDWSFRPINRLDKDTSGLVLGGKDAYTAFALKKVKKTYYAVCQGELFGDGVIDAPIRLKEGHGIQRETGLGGKPAVTHWRALAWGKGHTLLALTLETGRTHQIRVHLSSIGHPLAGDDFYGGSGN